MTIVLVAVMMLTILIGINLYLGKHIAKLPFLKGRKIRKGFYWFIFALIIALIFYTRTVLLGMYLYVLLLYFVTDLIGFAIRKMGDRAKEIWSKLYCGGILVFVMAFLLTVYGSIHASDVEIKNYELRINKNMGEIGELKILMISDIHLGTSVQEGGMDKLLQKTKELSPDIICFCGDIVDESTSQELKDYSYKIFSEMKAPLGIYYIIGNHETYREGMEDYLNGLGDHGIEVLKDEVKLIADSFYLVGRNELGRRDGSDNRRSMDQLLENVDLSYPVILMDHRPIETKNNSGLGIDLQMSGHTHSGQVFPGNLFTTISNDMNYGYKQVNNMHVVVSSGMGTWGFPMRVGSNSEVVMIKLHNN